MSDSIWVALGLMLIFEGLGPLLYPNRWSALMRALSSENPAVLRRIGGVLCVVGAVLLYRFL